MNLNQQSSRRLLPFSALLLCGTLACSGARAPSQPSTREAPAVGPEVLWVRDAVEYRALCRQIYADALEHLEKEAAQRKEGSWAVILDADETVLSNVAYQAWLAETGQSFETEHWNDWVRRVEADAVPGAPELLAAVHELGGRIAIVTNRREEVCEPTARNLEKAGLPYDILLCRDAERAKDERWRKVAEGRAAEGVPPLEVLAYFGDNIYDFPGWTQERRDEPPAAFEDFGARLFVLPNPLYGSWEETP